MTIDGRQIHFEIQFALNRDFIETKSIRIRAGDALLVDPLVVNFSGRTAELTGEKFKFDLDSDGTPDEISFVKPGSGFLFLDNNRDGRANDGSELFGPQTGNGFNELAELDKDGNGWLDANDPAFDRLRIWVKDSDGNDSFIPLKLKNIGAIFLDHQATPFSFKDNSNTLLGQLTDTGIFLRENGSAGTIQEINLTV